MALDDDDPFWEQHSGRGLHQGLEWQDGDDARAERFFVSMPNNARLILDYLMDRPGELVDVDVIANLLRKRRPGETTTGHRRAVAGSFTSVRRPAQEAGRRLPFYWWAGVNGSPTRYAMKHQVAQIFRDARHKAGLEP